MMKTMREKGGEENLKGRVLGRPMTSKDGKWRCGPKKKNALAHKVSLSVLTYNTDIALEFFPFLSSH